MADNAGGSNMGGMVSGGGDVFGDILNFMGTYLAWEQSSKAMMRDMRTAEENANLSAVLSADAIRRGNIESAKLRMQGTRLLDTQAAAYQGGGVDPTVGTPADIAQATAATTELDAQTAINNAYRESWGHAQQKKRFESERVNLRSEYGAKQDQYALTQTGTVMKAAGSAWKAAAGG